jgi:hypothetical protein
MTFLNADSYVSSVRAVVNLEGKTQINLPLGVSDPLPQPLGPLDVNSSFKLLQNKLLTPIPEFQGVLAPLFTCISIPC